jgi:hypothetical protein
VGVVAVGVLGGTVVGVLAPGAVPPVLARLGEVVVVTVRRDVADVVVVVECVPVAACVPFDVDAGPTLVVVVTPFVASPVPTEVVGVVVVETLVADESAA